MLEQGQQPQRDTLCYQCKIPYNAHPDDHAFIAYTFFKISSSERTDYQASLRQFNNPLNNSLHVVLGSKKTIQGINLIGVNNVYILSLPYNISNLIQVMGRAVRNKSHQYLPEQQRFVDIHILVNAMPTVANCPNPTDNELTKEHSDYIQKMIEHRQILEIDRIIHSVAIDVNVYGHNYFIRSEQGDFSIEDNLKLLPFKLCAEKKPFTPEKTDTPIKLLTTYNMLEFYT